MQIGQFCSTMQLALCSLPTALTELLPLSHVLCEQAVGSTPQAALAADCHVLWQNWAPGRNGHFC